MSATPQAARVRTPHAALFSFMLTTFALLAAACGGDGDDKPPKGYVLETILDSTRPGYEIARREDWSAQKGAKSGADVFDLFSAPEKVGNFTPNVNVYCDRSGAKSGTDNYTQTAVSELAKEKITAKVEKKVPIAGAQASMVTFSEDFDFAQIYATDINCAWVLTLTTPEGKRDDYMETFLQMAKTFKRY